MGKRVLTSEFRTNELIRSILFDIFIKKKGKLIHIVGEPGSGKSWAGLSFCEIIDPTFNIKRVCFTIENLVDLMNEPKLLKDGSVNPNYLAPGYAVMFDEGGTSEGVSSRLWYKKYQINLMSIIQTVRERRIIIVFTMPYTDLIDKQARKLANFVWETYDIDRQRGLTILKSYTIKIDPKREMTPLTPFFRIHNKRVKKIAFDRPSKILRGRYKLASETFKHSLYGITKDSIQNYIKAEQKAINKNLNVGKNIINKETPKVIEEVKHDGV